MPSYLFIYVLTLGIVTLACQLCVGRSSLSAVATVVTQQLEQCLDPLPDIINYQYSINIITDVYNQPITDDILHQMTSMIYNYPLHSNVLAILYTISSPDSPLKKELLGCERTLHQLCPKGDCHCRPVTGTSNFCFPALWHLDDVIPSIIGVALCSPSD